MILFEPEVELLFHLKPDLVLLFRTSYLTFLPLHTANTVQNSSAVLYRSALRISVKTVCVHLCGSGVIACLYGPGCCTNSLLNYHEKRSVIGSLTKHVYETILLKIPRIRGGGSWSIVVSAASLFSNIARNYFLYSWSFTSCLTVCAGVLWPNRTLPSAFLHCHGTVQLGIRL